MLFNGNRPDTDVVSWAEISDQFNLDDAAQQTYITALIAVATDYCEDALESSLINRTCTVVHYRSKHQRHHHRFVLPRGPVSAVTSVKDGNNADVVYVQERIGVEDFVILHKHPVYPITVTYTAGYGPTADSVPSHLKQAIKMHTVSLWERRASVSDARLVPTPHALEDFYRRRSHNCFLA